MGALKMKGSKDKGGQAKGRFQYKGRSADEVKQRAQRKLGSREGILTNDAVEWKPKEGDNTIRILPPTFDGSHYGVDVYIHHNIGPDKDAILCLDKMKGEPCPICEARVAAQDEDDDDLAYALRAGSRVLVYIIDRDDERKGPQVWSVAAGLDKDIVNLSVDKKTGEVYNIDDPEEGYDVSFTREGKDKKTKYNGIQIARRSSPLSDDEEKAEKWLNFITEHPLPDYLVYHDYDFIADAFKGTTVSEGDKPQKRDKEDPPAKPSRIKTRGSKKEEVDPDDDVNDGGKKGKAKKEDDDDPGTENTPPSWEELQEMDMDALGEVGEAFDIEFPDDPFDTEDEVREFIAEQLEIEIPKKGKNKSSAAKEEDPDAGGDDNVPAWKKRIAKMNKKGK